MSGYVHRLHSGRNSVGYARPSVQCAPVSTEWEFAVGLANSVLDRHDLDPDGDLCVLARQFLRALERLGDYYAPTRGMSDT